VYLSIEKTLEGAHKFHEDLLAPGTLAPYVRVLAAVWSLRIWSVKGVSKVGKALRTCNNPGKPSRRWELEPQAEGEGR
jgi:hypothetical protein